MPWLFLTGKVWQDQQPGRARGSGQAGHEEAQMSRQRQAQRQTAGLVADFVR